MRATPAVRLPSPDQGVLDRARAGDLDAFTDIVRAHERMVYGLAWHMLRDTSLAEEVAQDVFVALHQHLSGVESPDHLVFWLRRVASHRSIDAARRRRQDRCVIELPEDLAGDRHGTDPLLRRRLRGLVASLTPRARAVVVLRYQEDLDPTDIAAVLTMPLNTVKSHLRRSLLLLRARAHVLRKVPS